MPALPESGSIAAPRSARPRRAARWRISFSGALSGAVSLTKAGPGTLTLGGSNTYTGVTNVSAGTLSVAASGSLSGSTQIQVAHGAVLQALGTLSLGAGQTLSGSGTVTGTIGGAGVIAPGSGAGIMTLGLLNTSAGLDFDFFGRIVEAGERVREIRPDA